MFIGVIRDDFLVLGWFLCKAENTEKLLRKDIHGYPMGTVFFLKPAKLRLTVKCKKQMVFESDIQGFLELRAIKVGNSAKISIAKKHLPSLPARVFVAISNE